MVGRGSGMWLEPETDFGPLVKRGFVVVDDMGYYLMDFATREEADAYIAKRHAILDHQRRSEGK